ncbi:hypothetical protein E1176_12315 [Fulvivirga sp. RKSG066]|uniref:DUF4097 family beta strand repeat-containing protein n=1 Tax=Fulvivirga aurantia TaxID=2529383 RepID=UPI0012BBC114|nr:DUF4097 family beta strand repeat-containing protein [Fulvivirga aurantia]MTI21807.1 hypothetical protein [Fulvivirga aurantia]
MKNLQLNALAVLLIIIAYIPATAQQHKIAMSNGILEFSELSEVSVEGYDGSEIIIEPTHNYEIPERAKGLKPINALGLSDNTGIGLSAKKDGSTVTIYQVARNNDAKYTVKVPKGVMVRYHNSSIHGDDFQAKNMSNEIEVKTHGGDIHLIDITGPVTASSVHGDIDVKFSNLNQKLPSAIASVHGDVDVAFPSAASAELSIATNWGEVYSDLDIEVEAKDGMKVYGAKKIKGKLNKGGVAMSVSSTHGNVYLRKR